MSTNAQKADVKAKHMAAMAAAFGSDDYHNIRPETRGLREIIFKINELGLLTVDSQASLVKNSGKLFPDMHVADKAYTDLDTATKDMEYHQRKKYFKEHFPEVYARNGGNVIETRFATAKQRPYVNGWIDRAIAETFCGIMNYLGYVAFSYDESPGSGTHIPLTYNPVPFFPMPPNWPAEIPYIVTAAITTAAAPDELGYRDADMLQVLCFDSKYDNGNALYEDIVKAFEMMKSV